MKLKMKEVSTFSMPGQPSLEVGRRSIQDSIDRQIILTTLYVACQSRLPCKIVKELSAKSQEIGQQVQKLNGV